MSIEQTAQQERLTAIVRLFPQRKIVVVGDLVADQFLYGQISRVSREAPVLILRYERTETVPGGAANCAANLAALGGRASLIGFVGEDEAGRALLDKLCGVGVECKGLAFIPGGRTTTKVRILAGQVHSTRQQVIRIDYESESPIEESLRHQLRERLREELAGADAVIISDYNYGVADAETIAVVREVARTRAIPLLVDSRFNLARFTGFTSATPNEDEVEQLLERKLADADEVTRAGIELRERLNYQALLITRGSRGMALFVPKAPTVHIPIFGSDEIADVTGAGDTVMATMTLALAAGASFEAAARLANYAGGLVVMKRGTATVSAAELREAIRSDA